MRALVTICGTGVKGKLARLAYVLHGLEGAAEPFAIPDFGLGGIHLTHQPLVDDIMVWVAQQDGPIVIFAHSQGCLHALMFTLDHPDQVAGVVLLCGPLGGSHWVNLIAPPLRPVMRLLAPSVLDMQPGSQALQALRRRVATEWPAHVSVRLIAGQGDVWVWPATSAFDLLFPRDTNVQGYFFGLRLPTGLAHPIKLVRTLPPYSGHLSLMFHPSVLMIIRNLRRRSTIAVAQAS